MKPNEDNTKTNLQKRWIPLMLSGCLTILFLASGGAKLAGLEMLVEQFNNWGYPAWFLVLVGTMEVVGALALLVPFTRLVGALLLSVIMIGATVTHVMFAEWLSALVPIVLFVLLTGMVRQGIVRRQQEELPSGEEVQITP